jgi:DnaJ domain
MVINPATLQSPDSLRQHTVYSSVLPQSLYQIMREAQSLSEQIRSTGVCTVCLTLIARLDAHPFFHHILSGAMRPCIPNHYQVLQLAPDASQEQIRSSFHRLARELHPDRRRRKPTTVLTTPNSSCCGETDDLVHSSSLHEYRVSGIRSEPNGPVIPSARPMMINGNHEHKNETEDDDDDDERFRQVQDAYRCLHDPSRRPEYDEALRLQENRRKTRRRNAIALEMSDCRWVESTPDNSHQGIQFSDHKNINNHQQESADAKHRTALNADDDGSAVLVYTCRCGEQLYPLEEVELGEFVADDGLLDCPGCSAVYNVSSLEEKARRGPASSYK